MTTIAYKDGVLAADTQLTWGTYPLPCSKITRIRDDFVYAFSGTTTDEALIYRYFCKPEWRTEDFPKTRKDFAIIFIEGGIAYHMLNSPLPMPILAPLAIGSGGDFAIAAMAMGKSAEEAVKFASQFDTDTNNTVEVFNASDTFKQKAKASKRKAKETTG